MIDREVAPLRWCRMSFRESEFIAMVKERAAQQSLPRTVHVGVGDDAAVLGHAAAPRVLTTDMLLDGVDFELSECGPRAAGAKAIAKNLSDVAAMGALPEAAVVSVALPDGFTRDDASALLDGLFEVAGRFGCAIAGGDTKRSNARLTINVAMTGVAGARGPVLRSGALPGDALYVTGKLGGAASGRHLSFTPRVHEGHRLGATHGAHAMIDLSDGLSTDLANLCAASRVGARVDAERVPIHDDARVAGARTPLDHALNDGEDYELLFAADPAIDGALVADRELACGVTRIGTVTEAERGIVLVEGGREAPLVAGGFEHRFAPASRLALASPAPEATERLARALGATASGGEVFVLTGPLGAGKTTFVRGLLQGLGGDPRDVKSPTYGVLHRYPAAERTLDHFDAYFVREEEEFARNGHDEFLAAGDVVAVEWGEKFRAAFPEDALEVEFGIVAENERRLEFKAHGPRGRALLDVLGAMSRAGSAPRVGVDR